MEKFFTRIGDAVRWYPTGITYEEKILIFKIDLLVLVYACLSFVTKYLDVNALTTAYVSGMQQDLDLYENRLNYVNAASRKPLEEEGFKPSTGINRELKDIYTLGAPFILWLKSQPDKYSIPLVNDIGTITNAVAVVSALVNAYYTDIRGKRWEPIILSGVLAVFANLVLATWNVPNGFKFFAFISIGWAEGALPFIIAWAADSLSEDLEVRAITLATYNCLGEVTSLVVPLVAWAVSKRPRFFGGCIWALIISVAYFANTLIILIVERRSQKRKAEKRIIENESSEITNDYEKKITKSSAVVKTAAVRQEP